MGSLGLFEEGDLELVRHLEKEKKVVSALLDFLKVKTGDKLLSVLRTRLSPLEVGKVTLNKQIIDRELLYGYIQVWKRKPNGSYRTISIPSNTIKKIQSTLSARLTRVPISTAASGGEAKMSHIDNAQRHRYNPMMYVADVESAFPSVSVDRVTATLTGSLANMIDISYPRLKDSQRDLFIKTLAALTSYKNELPQGTSTSPRLLNIVMAKTDKDILNFVHDDSNGFQNGVFSRYIDDVTFSLKDYTRHMQDEAFKNKIMQGLGDLDYMFLLNGLSTEEIRQQLEMITQFFDSISLAAMSIDQKGELQRIIAEVKGKVTDISDTYTDNDMLRDYCAHLLNEMQVYETTHDKYTHKDVMGYIQHQMRKIMNNNGWGVKADKEKIWYPGSHHELREVTGITLDPKGNFGIVKSKLDKFEAFCEMAYRSPDKLPEKYKAKNGEINAAKIVATINGYKRYIEMIKGLNDNNGKTGIDILPSGFKYHYSKALEMYKHVSSDQAEEKQVVAELTEAYYEEEDGETTDAFGRFNNWPPDQGDDMPF